MYEHTLRRGERRGWSFRQLKLMILPTPEITKGDRVRQASSPKAGTSAVSDFSADDQLAAVSRRKVWGAL
jgi:hypothetical protein